MFLLSSKSLSSRMPTFRLSGSSHSSSASSLVLSPLDVDLTVRQSTTRPPLSSDQSVWNVKKESFETGNREDLYPALPHLSSPADRSDFLPAPYRHSWFASRPLTSILSFSTPSSSVFLSSPRVVRCLLSSLPQSASHDRCGIDSWSGIRSLLRVRRPRKRSL